MFRKIESYVTPIILAHVDKYIKNFKSEDTQVSLWSGAVVLHNLELKPNVIQDEFNLPFHLSSGYIHELIIHVPWRKIMSEPIMVTINTIECVLTLKTESTSPPDFCNVNRNKNSQETPPGYVQSLVNRIVNNISFRCNNLILKYVEEDIVMSVNIKHLFLDSVNGNWEPTFSDMTVEDLHIRKLITLSNLTLCLDKRNAAGKIETYLEPLLYRCELKIKLDSAYSGLLHKKPIYVRCHLSSPKIEISISHQQIPMIIRLTNLFWALKKKRLSVVHVPETRECTGSSSVSPPGEESENAPDNLEDTWSSWALSFMTPIYYSDDSVTRSRKLHPIFLFGVDLKCVSVVFKIPEYAMSNNTMIVNKKSKQLSTAKLILSSVLAEISSRQQRFCFRGGLKKIELYPENQCICGITDGRSSENQQPVVKYLESTTDADATEAKFWPIEFDEETVVNEMRDKEIIDICPALSVVYTYNVVLPDDFEDTHSEISTDLEYSNLKEFAVFNIALGPITVFLSAGLIHRLSMIKLAADTYDYPPYFAVKPLLKINELPPPTTDDYDTFMEFIPRSSVRLFVFEPKIIIAIWDHPDIHEKKESYPVLNIATFPTHKKLTISHREPSSSYHRSLQKIPHILFEANNIEATLMKPMYPIRLTYVICQLPDRPLAMFDACHESLNVKVNNLRCLLFQKSKESYNPSDSENIATKNKDFALPIVNDFTFYYSKRSLILPEYWSDNDSVILNDYTMNIDNVSFCGSMPKFMTFYYILKGFWEMNHKNSCINKLLASSLLNDIRQDDVVHVELVFDGILIRKISLVNALTSEVVINNIKIFAIKSNIETSNDDTVWIYCGPDGFKVQRSPFVKVVYQLSSNEALPSFITAKVEESAFVFDPFLYQFITYRYSLKNNPLTAAGKERSPTPKRTSSERTHKRSLDESTIHQSSKMSYKYTSLQSQSDREKDFIHSTAPTPLPNFSNNEKIVENLCVQSSEERSKSDIFANHIYKYRNLVISLDVEHLTAYLPTKPISAINCQTVYDAMKSNILNNGHYNLEDVLVIKLSNVHIKSSALKINLLEYCVHGLPSKLPTSIWDPGMTTYPWQIIITDLSGNTLSKGCDNTVTIRNVLKPVTLNVVISITTKLTSEIPLKKVLSNEMISDQVRGVEEKNANVKCNSDGNGSAKKYPPQKDDLPVSFIPQLDMEELVSMAIAVHVDMGWVILSVNQQQLSTLSVLSHGLMELMRALSKNLEVEDLTKNNSDHSFSSYIFEQHSLENSTSDTLPAKHSTKDTKLVSCDDSGINEETLPKGSTSSFVQYDTDISKSVILLTSWVQLTISRFTAKCYTNIQGVCTPDMFAGKEEPSKCLKLVLDVEDIMSSLDVHPEYTKLKCKIMTAHLKNYKSTLQNTWILGEHNGIILRGRENDGPLKKNEETSFILVTLTFARSYSVHNKWNEAGKKITKKFDNHTGEFIWEMEISMQSLDIILSPVALQPFLVTLSPLLRRIDCVSNKQTNIYQNQKSLKSPETWNSAIFPLCYFESREVRIIIPLKQNTLHNHHDVLVLQVDKLSILPVAKNPMCRQTLRPDLYEAAAREGWLGLPGGPLEDRQAQLTLKGISLYTCYWSSIATMEDSDSNAVNENPALRWNNLSNGSPNSDQLLSIINGVDIHIVLALSMYYKTTLVCGPAIDIGFMTDVEVSLTTFQLQLISSLYDEYNDVSNNVIKNTSQKSLTTSIFSFDVNMCPFAKYISKEIQLNNVKTHPSDRISKSATVFHSQNSLLTPNDPGFLGDLSGVKSSTSLNLSLSETKQEKVPREGKGYFDVICTMGKVTFMFHVNDDNASKKIFAEHEVILSLYIMLYQPNFLLSLQHSHTIFQASVFSSQISLSDKSSRSSSHTEDSFPIHLLESKSGPPDTTSGIFPALLTMKAEKNTGCKFVINMSVDCPVIFSISDSKIYKINQLVHHLKSQKTMKYFDEIPNKDNRDSGTVGAGSLRRTLDTLGSVRVSTSQVVLNLEIDQETMCSLSFSSLSLQSLVNPRLEKIFVIGLLQSFVFSLNNSENNQQQMIINPWTVGLEGTISWEPWRDLSTTNPLYQVILDADVLVINLGMKQLIILNDIIQYWQKVIHEVTGSKLPASDKNGKNCSSINIWSQMLINDQHYKDDLRAGAFKYVNCVNDTVPLPYQVVIGQRQISWCYPHPRALTRLYSYPMPFQLESGVNTTDTIVCTLQYYSEVMHCFMFYARFYVRQDQGIKLELPINDQYMKMASVWRIEMHLPSENLENTTQFINDGIFDKSKFLKMVSSKTKQPVIISDTNYTPLPVSPKMLPGCLRVDSYSSPYALPTVQFALKLPYVDINLHNSCQNLSAYTFVGKERIYTLDLSVPPTHVFATINFSKIVFDGSFWNSRSGLLNYKFDFLIDILNNSDFSLSRSIWCNESHGSFWWGGKSIEGKPETNSDGISASAKGVSPVTGVSFSIEKIGLRIGSHVVDSLFVASKVNTAPEFCSNCDGVLRIEDVVHRYVIKNDTCVTLQIGQIDTDENIILPPRTAVLYKWYSYKKPHRLVFTAHDGDWRTLKGFQIDECGVQCCQLYAEPSLPSLNGVVYVDAMGPCHRSITLSGCITIFNFLNETVEFKLYQRKSDAKPMVSPVFTLKETSQHESLFFDATYESAFRIRFTSSSGGWTGDIPLKPCPKEALPWLVKVPVKNFDVEYICLWCRVLTDPATGRVIVVLSPLYMIRSYFSTPLEVTLVSDESIATECAVLGKGIKQPLKLPGTTDTKHNVIFAHANADQQLEGLNVPFTFDRDLSKNKYLTTNTDFDTSLQNFQKWLNESCTWPYIQNELEEFTWTPLYLKCPNEIIVRFNYDVESIDAVIIEITPWTLFCNYAELDLVLLDGQKNEMCTLEHRCISTPPMSQLNPCFYISLVENGHYHLTSPLAISTDTNEPKDKNFAVINISKSFVIHCRRSIAVFNVGHDIKNSINIFKFSTLYVVLNRTKYDMWLTPIAIPLDSFEESGTMELPSPTTEQFLFLPGDPKSCSGKSIAHFFLLTLMEKDQQKIYTESDFIFFILLSLSFDVKSFSCPIKIDKSTSRKCISLQIESSSVAIVISCKQENNQTYISITENSTPQFLIVNNSDVSVAIGNVVANNLSREEHVIKVMPECSVFQWHQCVSKDSQIYYTMPTLGKFYPELTDDYTKPNSYLTFAYAGSNDDNDSVKEYIWSTPVNGTISCLEQRVRLPNYNKDLKISVDNHIHSTYITLDNISQVDISPSDIRFRLINTTERVSFPSLVTHPNINIEDIDTTSFENWDESYFDDIVRPMLLDQIYVEKDDIPAIKNDFSKSPSHSASLLKVLSNLSMLLTVKSLTISLYTDGGSDTKDVSSLFAQNVAVTFLPNTTGTSIVLTVSNLQIDNPLFSTGEYDFPVILMKKVNDVNEDVNSNTEISYDNMYICFEKMIEAIQSLRRKSLITLRTELEIWNYKSLSSSAVGEVSLVIMPVLTYVEDTYITTLLNCIAEFGPWCNVFRCHCKSTDKSGVDGYLSVMIPDEVMYDLKTLTRPVQIESLRIDPINVVLSLHINLQVYIGLDHSPLQFSRFERKNVITTSYKLGHALTMHYLAEVIYRAGWVVSSLEILGCPGGLARHVGAGLKALVAEPCRGLLGRGPWGFLVGMTHGSAVLLKHITQGTAESVSMVASNVARNLDRLSLDAEYMRRTEAARRAKPRGLPQGIARGFKAFALGIVGGASGLVTSPPNFPKGILGVVTKPLSATADLVAFTTQGLLGHVGWDPQPQPIGGQFLHEYDNWPSEQQEWRLKLGRCFGTEGLILYAGKGHNRDTGKCIALIMTKKWLLVIDLEREKVQQMLAISDISILDSDDGNLNIAIHKPVSKENVQESVARARVAAYVGDNSPTVSHANDLLRITISPNIVNYTISIFNTIKDYFQF